ncbi:MAG: hypothetical protein N2554_04585, partial [Fimbriimonadales bacterium]|nr:hypothetical protein [Fimbriimonadales bacterium]
IVAVVVGLPAVYLLLRAARMPVENPMAPWMVAELTFPLYFFPNTIGVLWHGIFALFFVLALALPYLRGLPLSPMAARTLQIWAIVAAGWYGLAWATPFWIQSLPLLQIHLIRATDLWYFSMSFLVAGLTALVIASTASDHPWRRALWGLALIGACLWPYLLSSTWKLIGLVLIIAPIAGELVWQVLKRLPLFQGERGRAGYYLTILLVGSALVGVHAMRERFYAFGHPLLIRYPTVETVARWAREHTAKDAMFLIPVHGEWRYFRYFSDRSVFVHQKDGDAFPYAPWYAAEWLRRMAQLGLFEVAGIEPQSYTIGKWVFVGGSEWMRPRINYYEAVSKSITEARVAHLAKEYRIDYWITYKETETNYPEVYAHGAWKVVKITNAR